MALLRNAVLPRTKLALSLILLDLGVTNSSAISYLSIFVSLGLSQLGRLSELFLKEPLHSTYRHLLADLPVELLYSRLLLSLSAVIRRRVLCAPIIWRFKQA